MVRLCEAKNRSYTSEQSMHEMLEAISKTLEGSILENIIASPYYSIIMDESTDLSTSKQLAIAVQYLNINTGTMDCKFLKLLDMTTYITATAENIVTCFTSYLEIASPSISLHKLAGASCDGASVMLGEENGVMARMKSEVPDLIVTHCAAHRIALAASDSAKAEPWFKRFETTLNSVYTYFSRSAVRTSELKEMQSLLDHRQLKLQRPLDTRWLSLENAVTAFRRSFKPVKAVLENEAVEGDTTAVGLSIQFSKPEFIVTLYFLSDVLDILTSLSCVCQSNNLNLLDLDTLVSDKIAALDKIKNDTFLGGFMTQLEIDYPTELSQIDRYAFKSKAEHYLSVLTASLRRRFPQIMKLSLLGFIQPQNVSEVGSLDITNLAVMFSLPASKLWNEYQSYTSFASRLDPPTMEQAVKEMWHPLHRDSMLIAYPLISKLLARTIVLPASSAEAERVFSTMNQIKTPLRNRLSSTTLDYLIRISM